MTDQVGIKLHNYFVAELYDSKTGELKQVVKAENLITDMGYQAATRLGTSFGVDLYVGTGTGTPATTDTHLFSYLVSSRAYGTITVGNVVRIGDNQYRRVTTIKFSENECNGTLTEIGLGVQVGTYASSYNLHTHALFTDAEGHPIQIVKTNSDTLTITATVFLEIAYTENSKLTWYYSRKADTNLTVDATTTQYLAGDAVSVFAIMILGSGWDSTSLSYSFNSLPICTINRTVSYSYGLGTTSKTYTTTGNTTVNRITTSNRILANNSNRNQTYEIRCFYMDHSSYPGVAIACTLPNESVYPAKTLTLNKIADGNTQDFNFGIPHLLTTDVTVKIDDTVLSPTQYTFNGIDYTMAQGWDSFDTKYVKQLKNFNYDDYYRAGPGWRTRYFGIWSIDSRRSPVGASETTDYSIIYDFNQPYTVTTVANILYGYASTVIPTLWYSNDMENWTQVTGLWSSVSEYQNNPSITLTTAISARYWKTVQKRFFVDSDTTVYKDISATIVFGNPKPQLHLNTAPSANSTVTVIAKAPYPIKNSNWIIESGMALDITVSPTS